MKTVVALCAKAGVLYNIAIVNHNKMCYLEVIYATIIKISSRWPLKWWVEARCSLRRLLRRSCRTMREMLLESREKDIPVTSGQNI